MRHFFSEHERFLQLCGRRDCAAISVLADQIDAVEWLTLRLKSRAALGVRSGVAIVCRSRFILEPDDRAPEDPAFFKVGERLVDLIEAVTAGHQFIEREFRLFGETQVHRKVFVR